MSRPVLDVPRLSRSAELVAQLIRMAQGYTPRLRRGSAHRGLSAHLILHCSMELLGMVDCAVFQAMWGLRLYCLHQYGLLDSSSA